jgi:membrane protease YdiL (CAAX protease family)
MNPTNNGPEVINLSSQVSTTAGNLSDFAPAWLSQYDSARSKPGFWKRHRLFQAISIFSIVPPLVTAWNPIIGIYVEYVAFAVLLGIALYSERARKLAVSAAILPMSMMLAFCVPHVTYLTDTTVLYGAMLAFAIIYQRILANPKPVVAPISAPDVRLADFSQMLLIGLIFGGEGYFVLRHYYLYQGTPLLLVAVVAAMSAAAEVILFQGLIQEQASRIMKSSQAAVLTTILFAAANIGRSTWLTAAFALTIGGTMAMTYYSRRNLGLVLVTNIAMKVSYVCLVTAYVIH